MKLLVMVAGPYTSGGADAAKRADNLRALNRAALAVFERGHIPVVGVSHALPLAEQSGVEDVAELRPTTLELTDRCDAVLRIGGPSEGADAEVARFRAAGKPVYTSLEDLPGSSPEPAE
jgi:hypothetical protein